MLVFLFSLDLLRPWTLKLPTVFGGPKKDQVKNADVTLLNCTNIGVASQLPLSYRPGGFAHKRKKLMFAISYETSQGVWHRDGYMTEMAFSLLWSKLKGEEEKWIHYFSYKGRCQRVCLLNHICLLT